MSGASLNRFADRGYSDREAELFRDAGHRVRRVVGLASAACLHAIEGRVVEARHGNSGHAADQTLVLDVDGNLLTEFCPKRVHMYLLFQLTVPVALLKERLREGFDPNGFHFMRQVRCPDAGVECLGCGEVPAEVHVVPRKSRARLCHDAARGQFHEERRET